MGTSAIGGLNQDTAVWGVGQYTAVASVLPTGELFIPGTEHRAWGGGGGGGCEDTKSGPQTLVGEHAGPGMHCIPLLSLQELP